MFSGLYWNQPVCRSVCLSVYKILVSVEALLGGIKSHLVTAVVIPPQNKCFRGYTGISLSVLLSIHVSVCVQNTWHYFLSKHSHSVTALVYFPVNCLLNYKIFCRSKLKALTDDIILKSELCSRSTGINFLAL